MSSVCIIDTSVFLNLLNVPGRNQEKEAIKKLYDDYVELEMTFILPMATIIETGNHIAQNGNGKQRRQTAQKFCEVVKAAFKGDAPYTPSEFPNIAEIVMWIDNFPDYAGKNKSEKKTNEGTSFGDLSIIKEYEKCVRLYSTREVFIWSLDSDLSTYQHLGSCAVKSR
jgi:predicted nucleic acid-binding protein